MDITNRYSPERLTIIGDEGDDRGRSIITTNNARDLVHLGETNSKS